MISKATVSNFFHHIAHHAIEVFTFDVTRSVMSQSEVSVVQNALKMELDQISVALDTLKKLEAHFYSKSDKDNVETIDAFKALNGIRNDKRKLLQQRQHIYSAMNKLKRQRSLYTQYTT